MIRIGGEIDDKGALMMVRFYGPAYDGVVEALYRKGESYYFYKMEERAYNDKAIKELNKSEAIILYKKMIAEGADIYYNYDEKFSYEELELPDIDAMETEGIKFSEFIAEGFQHIKRHNPLLNASGLPNRSPQNIQACLALCTNVEKEEAKIKMFRESFPGLEFAWKKYYDLVPTLLRVGTYKGHPWARFGSYICGNKVLVDEMIANDYSIVVSYTDGAWNFRQYVDLINNKGKTIFLPYKVNLYELAGVSIYTKSLRNGYTFKQYKRDRSAR